MTVPPTTWQMVEGTQVGAYKLLRRIGEGGMGVVWLAEHTMLGRRAAVKVLHPSFSMQPEIVTRFFNEARAATAISDPGIVQIFDFGNHVDGSAYIVMELLEGEPLDAKLHREGVMAVGEALRILRQAASTLGAAHARGIIHRDLKPENIYLVRDPEVAGGTRAKILDFGIAKLTGDHAGAKTATSAVMGTPAYMSPEQCRGAGLVDARSDVYALGCVLMTLLTGRPPFEAEGIGELIVMHMREQPPVPSSRVSTVPLAVDQLVLRCLAKDPGQRYASGTELANALSVLVTQPSLDVAPVGFSGAIAAVQPTTLSAMAGPVSTTAVSSGNKSRLWLALAGVAVVGGVAVVMAVKGSSSSPEPASAPEASPVAAPETGHSVTTAAPPPAPSPTPPPPPSDERPARAKAQVGEAVAAFVTWAATHASSPCPKLEDLMGQVASDPWGHPIVLTCTDQPAHQIVGLISAGPDGSIGTADDITSWNLDKSVTNSIRGPRWAPIVASKKPARSKPATKSRPTSKPAKKPATGVPGDVDGDGIPDSR